MKKKDLLKLKLKEIKEMYPDHVYKVGTKKEAYIDEILKPKGLGDTIEKITEVTGIKKAVELITGDCGCSERKQRLNQIFPYNKPQCLTDEQLKSWNDTAAEIEKTQTITEAQQNEIIYLLKEILNMSVSADNCRSCSPQIWKKYIGMINKVATA